MNTRNEKQPQPRRFMTLAEVGDELGCSPAQTYSLVRSGSLRAIKIGGRGQWRVSLEDLQAYMTKPTPTPGPSCKLTRSAPAKVTTTPRHLNRFRQKRCTPRGSALILGQIVVDVRAGRGRSRGSHSADGCDGVDRAGRPGVDRAHRRRSRRHNRGHRRVDAASPPVRACASSW